MTVLALMLSCNSGTSNECALPVLEDSPESVFVTDRVLYCWQKPLEPRRGSVQVLVDASGSMVGFQKAVPDLVNWIEHAISQLQGSALTIEHSRICQFSQRLPGGIGTCASSYRSMGSYRPSGDTNLHDAIRSAKDHALTFILTDGVAATGTKGSGDCATGVDAACVARALREVVHSEIIGGKGVDWGIWICPLIANYDGTFYTEEPILPTDFNPRETIKRVRSDIGAEVVVQDPHAGPGGHLVFRYRGPRALLLIIIARWTDVGRAATEALWERAEYLGLHRIEEMRASSSRLSTLPPIEVYPGFLNSIEWKTLQESDDPNEICGTMDVSFQSDPEKATIGLTCPQGGGGEGYYHLTGSSRAVSRVSGCVPIGLLPAFRFRFEPVNQEDATIVRQLLKGYRREEGSYTNLQLHLACRMNNPRPCPDSPISLQWMAYMNYAEAADCLASPECTHSIHQLVKSLSTAHPSQEPHRIFAFSNTLETFYREVTQDQRSIALADLDVCHNQ